MPIFRRGAIERLKGALANSAAAFDAVSKAVSSAFPTCGWQATVHALQLTDLPVSQVSPRRFLTYGLADTLLRQSRSAEFVASGSMARTGTGCYS